MTTLAYMLPAFTFAHQRMTCEACRHVQRRVLESSRASTVVLKCGTTKNTNSNSCSLLRAPGQPCGPEAKLFEGVA